MIKVKIVALVKTNWTSASWKEGFKLCTNAQWLSNLNWVIIVVYQF